MCGVLGTLGGGGKKNVDAFLIKKTCRVIMKDFKLIFFANIIHFNLFHN